MRRAAEGPMAQMFRDWRDGALAMEQASASWVDSTVSGIARLAATGKADFRGLADSIIEDIIRIQIRALVANLATGAIGSDIVQGVGGFLARAFTPSVSPTGVVTRAGGGYVSGPGTSTSDSIPARLSDGEYVINARAVRMFGRGMFESLNRGMLPPSPRRFASGGYVGSGNAPMQGGATAVVQVVNASGMAAKTETTRENGIDVTRVVIGTIRGDLAQNGELSRLLQRTYGLQQVPGRR